MTTLKKFDLNYMIMLFFLYSCAYVPKNTKVNVSNSPKIGNEFKCKRISARFGLSDHIPFEVKYLRHSELVEKDEQTQAETVLLNEIKETRIFNLAETQDSSEKLVFGFTIYRETDNYGFLWLPIFTLGIIPAAVDTHYSLGLRVFDGDGKLLKEYSSSVVDFKYYVGLWFIPIAKKETSLNLRDIEKKYLPRFFDEIMTQVKRDKIINCN